MYRSAIEQLHNWKYKKNKKPLIIRGARQVGKTWLMKEFGRKEFKKTVYINFDNNPQMKELFSLDMNIQRIITGIQLYIGFKIDIENTLIIFDEIQEVPQALSSLKYFNEEASEYQIICAGSLLGVALHEGTSFPVGKVEFMDLYPLSFNEFMQAMGKEQYVELLNKNDFEMATTFKLNYIELLKYYYFVGGMPEAVQHFVNNRDFNEVRVIQQNILDAYEQDFSKHAPNDIVPRIRMMWNSIPKQLAKENKKFIYGLIKTGARAKEYEMALMWLIDCGLVYKIQRVTTPNLPLKAYEDLKAFKLFILDVGLLSCIVNLDQSILISGNTLFKEFKGALSEQYVLQQLKTLDNIEPYYWTNDRGTAEIDFLLDAKNKIIPLEVKAETNLKAKSLKVFYEKYKPEIAIRTSMADYKQENWLLNLPLWGINTIK
ncbi:putative AAA+ superfamily ATPase [Breznakia sp. PF5-3]|uniref:ATP-binding protein n=1 Tax=unclassified Breznakia TaxID=2623764 RepID=UPI0024076209|nr:MULTISPECIES: ATP-binding protein [unclassified Breznakia]MDF9824545.1 putative AAA+ superfamily ATPase [Breznakia sp. PM6-1]MDF9835331.1 putative AAA+ superfamily ATPase [Breznakia sp. PF5-3]MDF9837067.1 putative AAA+ superfamily ATPase [Breznakia sp. PFB2-8]MDF9858992.1 putative AAA+ superfamily ATPase [Breznakia sp. PH5-24]